MLTRWRYVWFEFRRLPTGTFLRTLAHQVARALVLRARRCLHPCGTPPTPPAAILARFAARDGNDAVRRLRDRHAPPFFIATEQAPALAARFREKFPEVAAQIVEAADRARAHEFDLLGSGPVRLGEEIPWQTDFKTGFRFPAVHHSRVPIYGLPGGADIKVPWEMSRCQHFIPLGQAYWLTGNEAYAEEIHHEILSWIGSNPPGVGCNWACSMDVALRAANWAWAYAFIRYSPACDDEFLVRLFSSLTDHGRHIFANLERTPAFAGNHYVSDLLGLAYLGLLFPELPDATRWRDFARAELEREILRQTHPDGVNFEASIPYHRLATELFLFPYLLYRAAGTELSETYARRLAGMLDFVHHYLNTAGEAPAIGDNDDGRVHTLAPIPIPDHRYLLAVGAAVFNKPEWRQADAWANAYAFWALASLPFAAPLEPAAEEQVVRPESRAFPDGGCYALRRGDVVALVDAGGTGQEGRGGHAHHDALAVVLAVGGTWVLRDAGTGVYTADPARRNRMRATAAHNTVVIDDREQGDLPAELFLLGPEAQPVVEAWESGPRADRLVAFHDGYRKGRRRPGVRHRREVYFDKELGFFRIVDELEGTGEHTFRQRWHLGDVEPRPLAGAATMATLLDRALLAKGSGPEGLPLREDLGRLIEYNDFRVSLLFFGPETVALREEWYEYSETYGSFRTGTVLELAGTFEERVTVALLLAVEM